MFHCRVSNATKPQGTHGPDRVLDQTFSSWRPRDCFQSIKGNLKDIGVNRQTLSWTELEGCDGANSRSSKECRSWRAGFLVWEWVRARSFGWIRQIKLTWWKCRWDKIKLTRSIHQIWISPSHYWKGSEKIQARCYSILYWQKETRDRGRSILPSYWCEAYERKEHKGAEFVQHNFESKESHPD